jgi:hypothetical protein
MPESRYLPPLGNPVWKFGSGVAVLGPLSSDCQVSQLSFGCRRRWNPWGSWYANNQRRLDQSEGDKSLHCYGCHHHIGCSIVEQYTTV